MRPWSALARMLPLAAAALLAACDDDGGGTGSDPLTPAEVGAVYRICALTFTPTQTALPAANLLANVVDATSPETSLRLSGVAREYQIVYTRKSDRFLQTWEGSTSLLSDEVLLSFPSTAEVTRELLLPNTLDLAFTPTPRRLQAATFAYNVRRADYARAAGISENDLAPTISGRLTGTFAEGSCQ